MHIPSPSKVTVKMLRWSFARSSTYSRPSEKAPPIARRVTQPIDFSADFHQTAERKSEPSAVRLKDALYRARLPLPIKFPATGISDNRSVFTEERQNKNFSSFARTTARICPSSFSPSQSLIPKPISDVF